MVGQSRSPLLVQCRSIVSTLAQHHSNTDRTHDSSTPVYSNHWTANRCCFNVDPTTFRVWRWPNNNPAFCIHRLLCGNCYRGDNFIPNSQKGHYPDTLAQLWNNVGPPSATLSQHYSNQNPWDLIIDLTTNIIVIIIISEHLLKTKLLNLRTSNVILHMFIMTGVQKCQPFPTHSTPLSPK